MPKKMSDYLAGEGSFAGKLKKQREAYDSGDEAGGRKLVGDTYVRVDDTNSPDNVIRRGYYIEKK